MVKILPKSGKTPFKREDAIDYLSMAHYAKIGVFCVF
jgi:hypothetical protein